MTSPIKKSVLYLDLDGTVRYSRNGTFVNAPEDVAIYPEALRGMREYCHHRFERQVSERDAALVRYADDPPATREMMFDRITACVHHPDAPDPEYAVCWCRKPRIGGLVLTASGLAEQHDEYYPPHISLFVGDRPEDEECAKNAGIPFLSAEQWRRQVWE